MSDPDEFAVAVSGASLRADFLGRQRRATLVEQFQTPCWTIVFQEAEVRARILGFPPPGWASAAVIRGEGESAWYGRVVRRGFLVCTPLGEAIDGWIGPGFRCSSIGVPPSVWEQSRIAAGLEDDRIGRPWAGHEDRLRPRNRPSRPFPRALPEPVRRIAPEDSRPLRRRWNRRVNPFSSSPGPDRDYNPTMEKFDEKEAYARTRKSLIERLADWEDQRTWNEFYQTYWRLIYSVSLKAGLGREEAFDVVQETVLAVAKQWKKGQVYDPEKGSFKTWLMNITRWRISDHFRAKQRNPAAANQAGGTPGADGDERRTATIERLEGENGADVLDQVWEREWMSNLTDVALQRVKKLVSPNQYQIFHAYVVKEWEVAKVMRELGVSQSQVYLAKHRIGAMLKEEIEKLKGDFV